MYKLTDQEVMLFKKLSTSRDGKLLLGYLNRVKVALSDLTTLTPDNFAARKESVSVLEEVMVKPLEAFHPDKDTNSTNRQFT